MKKLILGTFLFLGIISALYAESNADKRFKEYVELTRKNPNNLPGSTIVADNTYRIMYMTLPLNCYASQVSPEQHKKARELLVEGMRKQTEDVKIIKELKISLVYTLITKDKKVFCITFSYNDL